jgi:predicted nucleic acid-binding protein
LKTAIIADTGPLVALLNRKELHHDWAREQFALFPPPVITCEAVLSEACFLLRDIHGGVAALLELTARGVVEVAFSLQPEFPAVKRLLIRYASVPMSLADACLVRMAEQNTTSVVVTLDRHFTVYRKSGRLVIPTLMP